MSFTNWAPGEPNGGTIENHVHFWNNTERWNDESTGPHPGIVEHPGGPTAPLTATLTATAAPPAPVTGHALASLPANGGTLLFGGNHATSPQPFTYVLTGTTWTKQFSLLNPMVRSDHSLLLDPVRQNNLLFGGRNPLGTALADTWIWQSGQWTYVPLGVSPSPRSHHRMTFDPTSGTGLLFGGKDVAGQPLGDFWSWNGTGWTHLTPSLLPPARFAHGFAFDALRNRAVLTGGSDGTNRLADVWEWNGTAWTQALPTAIFGPGPRDQFAFAYDPRAERCVLHGGNNGNCLGDTWSWSGTDWALHLASTATPSPRTGHAMLHDASSNRLLAFAGGCGTTLTNDLWQLDLPVYWRQTIYGQGCVGTSGVPALTLAAGSTAILGTTMQFELANVPWSFSVSLGFIGFQRETLFGLPLPLPLDPLGLPGCSAHTAIDITATLSLPNPQGISTWAVVLPSLPQLLGSELNFQTLSLEAPAFPRWASVSNGLYVRCGNY
ncbi:MAG: hypothetical protein WAT39_20715 [Planctomycetota bacterium]